MSKLKILLVTSELAEVAPVGGIAQYVFGLATSLLRRGHDVRIAIPSYGYLPSKYNLRVLNDRLVVHLGIGFTDVTAVHEMHLDCPGKEDLRLPVIVAGGHRHFVSVRSPKDIYDWPNHEPWIAFSRTGVDHLRTSNWRPDVIHCQDAHTALIPIYVAQLREQDQRRRPDVPATFAPSTTTVLTIHNLQNKGEGPRALLDYADLPDHLFATHFEYWGHANSFKGGLLSTDRITTVSKTYAREICMSKDFGFGLEGVLQSVSGKLTGIVNGIDEDQWKMKGVRYDGTDLAADVVNAKKAERKRLYPDWEWQETDEPVIAFKARWDRQKGIELIGRRMEQLLRHAKVVFDTLSVPGPSDPFAGIWYKLTNLAEAQPQRLKINAKGTMTVPESAALYAIADFFLMPSIYEPCGLAQMECQRYGAVPIVRETGGLADTVSEEVARTLPSPNGFVFREATAEAMMAAVDRAIKTFHDPRSMHELIRNALKQQNGWDNRVMEYEAVYGANQE